MMLRCYGNQHTIKTVGVFFAHNNLVPTLFELSAREKS